MWLVHEEIYPGGQKGWTVEFLMDRDITDQEVYGIEQGFGLPDDFPPVIGWTSNSVAILILDMLGSGPPDDETIIGWEKILWEAGLPVSDGN